MWERYPLVALLSAEKGIKSEISQERVNSLAWCQKQGELAKIHYFIFDKIQHWNPDRAVLYLYDAMKKGFYLAIKKFNSGQANLNFVHENRIVNLETLNASELFTLGLRSYSGLCQPRDDKLTLHCFEKIVSLNPLDLEAQNNLGVLFKEVIKKFPEAIERFHFAATRGNAEAQYNLGNAYHTGLGILHDENEAMKWYRCAATQGHYLAQNNLGWMLVEEKQNEESIEEGVKWLICAAEQGSTKARYYLERLGCTLFSWDTLKWKKRTAMEGDKTMAWSLGLRYKSGRTGLPKSNDEAAKWYRVATKNACNEELVMYLTGIPSFTVRYHHYLCQRPVKQEIVELIRQNRTCFLQLLKDDDVINQEDLFHIIEWVCEISSLEEWGELLTDYLSYLTFAQMVMLFKDQMKLSKYRTIENECPHDPALDVGLILFDLLKLYKSIIHDEIIDSVEQDAFSKMIYFTLSLFLTIARESQHSLRGDLACVFAKLLMINFCELAADSVVNNLADLERAVEISGVSEKLDQYSSVREPSNKKLKP